MSLAHYHKLLLTLGSTTDLLVGIGGSTKPVSGQLSHDSQHSGTMHRSISVTYVHTPLPPAKSLHGSSLVLNVKAAFETCVHLAVLLSWLCATIRYSKHELLCRSEVNWKIEDSSLIILPTPLSAVERRTCWHDLFMYSVVATQFEIPVRQQGKGLEITFSDMMALSRALRMLELRDCVVAEAPQNLLVVMNKMDIDGGFQW